MNDFFSIASHNRMAFYWWSKVWWWKKRPRRASEAEACLSSSLTHSLSVGTRSVAPSGLFRRWAPRTGCSLRVPVPRHGVVAERWHPILLWSVLSGDDIDLRIVLRANRKTSPKSVKICSNGLTPTFVRVISRSVGNTPKTALWKRLNVGNAPS